MFQNCVSGFRSLCSKAREKAGMAYALMAVALVSLSTGSVFAAGETPTADVSITDSGIDWSKLCGDIITALMIPLGLAIGLAISIWIVMLGWRAIRKNVKA